jgi:hypothetical protein
LREKYEEGRNFRNCSGCCGDCTDLWAHGSNSFFFWCLISSLKPFGSPLVDSPTIREQDAVGVPITLWHPDGSPGSWFVPVTVADYFFSTRLIQQSYPKHILFIGRKFCKYPAHYRENLRANNLKSPAKIFLSGKNSFHPCRPFSALMVIPQTLIFRTGHHVHFQCPFPKGLWSKGSSHELI